MIESDKKESDKKTCRSLMVELSSFKGKDEGSVPSGRTKIGDKEFISFKKNGLNYHVLPWPFPVKHIDFTNPTWLIPG